MAVPVKLLGRACRNACFEISPGVDEDIFGGAEGASLPRCPLLTRAKYFEGVLHLGQSACTQESIRCTAVHISDGTCQYDEVCWECGKPAGTQCKNCGFATHCPRSCQAAQWGGSHKKQCMALKKDNECLKESFGVIDSAHNGDNKSMMGGTKLCGRHDCRALSCMSQLRAAGASSFLGVLGLRAPSALISHKSLGRAVRGAWWMNDDAGKGIDGHKSELSRGECLRTLRCKCIIWSLRVSILTFLEMPRLHLGLASV